MRDNRVSISKGICIILMVYCHAGCNNIQHDFIYMFHMPLFFFVSGYCFKEKYLCDVASFIKNKIKGIWWPYVKYVSIFVILHNLFIKIGIFYDGFVYRNVTMTYYTLKEILIHLLNTLRFCHGELLLAGFWFLFTLFMASILFLILTKLIKNKYVVAAISFILMFVFNYFSYILPLLHIGDKEFQAVFFMSMGFICKSEFLINEAMNKWIANKAIVLMLFILVFIGSIYFPSEMISLEIKTIIPYSLFAILGALLVFSVSGYIIHCKKVAKVFIYVGDNTLPILIWHFFLFKVISLFLIWIYGLNIRDLAEFPTIKYLSLEGWNLVYTLFAVTFSLVFDKMFHITNLCKWNINIR